MTAINAGQFRFERCMTGTQPLVGSIAFKWCDADQHDASLNHAEIFGDATRDIDDAAPMLGVHAVIDLDDGTAVIVQAPYSDRTPQRKTIAGGSELLYIETFASRGFSTVKALTIKAGLAAQAYALAIQKLRRAGLGLRQGLVHMDLG